MHVLVTGGAGFIGSHVVELLQQQGHQVTVVDCLLPDSYDDQVKRERLAELELLEGVDVEVADLRTADLDGLLSGVDAVINEAAMPGLMKSWADYTLYESCNLSAVNRLVEACKNNDVQRFVQISTSSVYGRDAVGDETSPTEPVSPYGVTKLAAEKLLLAHHQAFDFPAVILRYYSVYGPGQRPDMAYHIFCEALLDRRPITVFGDGEQERSNTYVTDAATATVAALTKGTTGGIYNIAGGQTVTVNEAIKILAQELDTSATVIHEPARPGDQRITRGATAKAQRELGWTASTGITAGLAAQAAWHRSRR